MEKKEKLLRTREEEGRGRRGRRGRRERRERETGERRGSRVPLKG